MTAARFSTYDILAQKEDVSDEIKIITPRKTPYQTMIGTGRKLKQKYFQWQEDALAGVADVSVVEGSAPATPNMTATTIRANWCEIFTLSVATTGTSEATEIYGKDSELAYQYAKKLAEMKRHFERALVGRTQNAAAGNETNTPRRTGNIFSNDALGNPMVAAGNVLANGGTGRALTEALVLSALDITYDKVGDGDYTLMVKPSDTKIIANFAYASGRLRDGRMERKLVNVVDVYEGPLGSVKVVPNRFMLTTRALLFDPSTMKVRPLRSWFTQDEPEAGDRKLKTLWGEYAFWHEHYEDAVIIADLS